MRVPVGMRLVAALGAGFRSVAWPHAGVDRLPRPFGGEWIRRHQALQGRLVHGPRIERVIHAAPAALTARRQAQMCGRFEARRTQEGIEEREQGVTSTAEEAIHLLAEGSQRFQFGGVHTRSMRARAFSCLLDFTDTPL